MAIVTCDECKKEISDKATTCPHCGAPRDEGARPSPPPASKAERLAGCFLMIVGFIVLAVMLSIVTKHDKLSSGSESSPAKTDIQLHIHVGYYGGLLYIKNLDSFDWTNCELELNSPTFSSGFVLQVDRIASGSEKWAALADFAKSDGERFNAGTRKPQDFSAACDTPSGRGEYFGGWK